MPPKKDIQPQKVEILPRFNYQRSQPFWQYIQYTNEEIQIINQFFKTYEKELKDIIKPNDFSLSIKIISEKLGVQVHPCFLKKQEIESLENQQTEIKDEQKQINKIFLQNIKIDYATMKILMYVIRFFPIITVLKFSRNLLSPQIAELIFTDYSPNITELFFENNPPDETFIQDFFGSFGSTLLYNLESLILRSNLIDCQIIKMLCYQIKINPNCNIKHLELFDNRIGEEGLIELGDLINQYQKLVYLSLSQNKINSIELVKPILNQIGKVPLTTKEQEEYKQIEVRRTEMIETANKKKKKITEEDLPQLPKIQDLDNGEMGNIKNIQLQMINLAMNPFRDSDLIEIDKFLEKLPPEFSLIIVHSLFEYKIRPQKHKKKQAN